MPTFDIIKKHNCKSTFRVDSVLGTYDIQSREIIESFKGEINLSDSWQIGLIVGKSGTGKTTIANQLFSNILINSFEYSSDSILDDMPLNCSVQEICKTFNSVGFSSPPSWLKPYSVLSNGEKMRVNLARAILDEKDLFAFDEFTSVVDREVAKVGSFAMQKAIRKTKKKFIAITCHHDVESWLLPDWVFNTDTMTFHNNEGQKKNRPNLKFEIFQTGDKSRYWKMFSKYHYLSHSHNNAANTYLAVLNEKICGFISILHFPHAKSKNIKKVHRLVVLPDYQGLGVGKIMLNEIGLIYRKNGFRFNIVTSSPNLIYSLKKSNNWIMTRFNRTKEVGKKSNRPEMKGSSAKNRITASFELK